MNSIFMDINAVPDEEQLEAAIGPSYKLWAELSAYTKLQCPAATEAWHYAGKKFGWSVRLSDKKRVILYLLPRDKFFRVALVFGQKAVDEVLASNISPQIKEELRQAKAYGEGRGIRIPVTTAGFIADIKQLIRIKTRY